MPLRFHDDIGFLTSLRSLYGFCIADVTFLVSKTLAQELILRDFVENAGALITLSLVDDQLSKDGSHRSRSYAPDGDSEPRCPLMTI